MRLDVQQVNTSYLKKNLGLRYTPSDLSFSYHDINNILHELLEVYVGDTLATETDEFMRFKIPEKLNQNQLQKGD